MSLALMLRCDVEIHLSFCSVEARTFEMISRHFCLLPDAALITVTALAWACSAALPATNLASIDADF